VVRTARTAVVTGGTDGIGKEIALGPARQDLQLIIVGRDADKGIRAQSEISAATHNNDVHLSKPI
jgi:short-subunit dehydrogenase